VELEPSTPPASAGASPAEAFLNWTDRQRWWIFGGILLLYLAGFNGQWRIAPDTALYAIVGRNVAEGNGYTHPLGDQIALTPGLPWIIAGVFKAFGSGNFVAIQAVMLLMSLATLILFYHTIKLNAGRPAAVAIAFMLAVTDRFYGYAFELMADLPFLFGVMLFLLGYEATWKGRETRAWPWLCLFTGTVVMALSRSVVLVFLAGLILATIWLLIRRENPWRQLLILLIAIGGILLARSIDPRLDHPFQLMSDEYIVGETFSASFLDLLGRIITHNLPEFFEDAAPEALFGIELGPVINTLIAILVLVLGMLLFLHRALWAFLVAAFVGQMVIFFYVTPRYFLPILPLLIAAGWLGAKGLDRVVRQPLGGWLAIILMFAWTTPNLVKVCGTILEQRHPDFYAVYANGDALKMAELGQQTDPAIEPDAWLLIRDPRWRQPLTYFTRRRVVPLQRFDKLSREKDVIYYVEQGLRRFPRRITTRREWRFADPIVTVDRGHGLDPWTIRRITPRPATRPVEE
jgi:hypothetical protein